MFYFSLWFKLGIFFSLVLFSFEMYNRSGKKLTRKNLNVDRLFFKNVLCVTLLQEGEGGSTNFRKNCLSFLRFPFINTSSQIKIFIYSTYPFLLQPPPCPSTALLINHIYSWKSKLKHTVKHLS